MREDELYKLAKEELNSRDRKADLWARACALATDDVDEARYLYTNLRVEELAAENNIDLTALDPEAALADDVDQDLTALSTGNLSDTSSLSAVAEDLTPAQFALERSRQDFGESEDQQSGTESGDGTGEASEAEDDDALTLSLEALDESDSPDEPVTSVSDLVLGELANDQPGDADNTIHINADDSELTEALSSVDILSQSDDDLDASSGRPESKDPITSNDLSSESTVVENGRKSVDNTENTSPSEGHSDADVSEPVSTITDDQTDDASLDAKAGQIPDVDSDDDASRKWVTSGGLAAAASVQADAPDALMPGLEPNLSDSPEDESNGRYAIYEHPNGLVNAIERGNNWKAMLLTQPWLLSRKMWGTAVIYALMSTVLLIGLLVMLPRAFSEHANALDLPVAGGFVLLALIGWLFLPLKFSNEWYENTIIKRGFRLLKTVDAQSRKAAEQTFVMARQSSS